MAVGEAIANTAAEYGKFVAWKHIIGGIVTISLVLIVLAYVVQYHHNYQQTTASITGKVACRQVTTGTETLNGQTKPIIGYACVAPIEFSVNKKTYKVQLSFSRNQPFSDINDTIRVEFDPLNPATTVQTPSALESKRGFIVAGLIAFIFITLGGVYISYKFSSNRVLNQFSSVRDLASRF